MGWCWRNGVGVTLEVFAPFHYIFLVVYCLLNVWNSGDVVQCGTLVCVGCCIVSVYNEAIAPVESNPSCRRQHVISRKVNFNIVVCVVGRWSLECVSRRTVWYLIFLCFRPCGLLRAVAML
jgi:hypothetical protein